MVGFTRPGWCGGGEAVGESGHGGDNGVEVGRRAGAGRAEGGAVEVQVAARSWTRLSITVDSGTIWTQRYRRWLAVASGAWRATAASRAWRGEGVGDRVPAGEGVDVRVVVDPVLAVPSWIRGPEVLGEHVSIRRGTENCSRCARWSCASSSKHTG